MGHVAPGDSGILPSLLGVQGDSTVVRLDGLGITFLQSDHHCNVILKQVLQRERGVHSDLDLENTTAVAFDRSMKVRIVF